MNFLFYGCGAYVGRVLDRHKVEFWSDDPEKVNYDDTLLQSVDLQRSIGAFLAGDANVPPRDVQVGDTNLAGPYPMNESRVVGYVYLAHDYWQASMAGSRIKWPPMPDGRPYEFQEVLYVSHNGSTEAQNGLWFRGFHAKVVNPNDNGNVVLDVFHGGRSKVPGEPPKRVSIPTAEFGDITKYDKRVSNGGYTEIDPGDPTRHEGALFIEFEVASELELEIGKLPPGKGRSERIRRRP